MLQQCCQFFLSSSLLLLHLFPLGGVSGPNSWFPECSVLDILRGDPQFLHIPSDAIIHLPLLVFLLVFFLALSYQNFSHFMFSSILCMCPYQRSLIFLTFSCILFTPSSFLMSTLFTLSLSGTPLILLNILISVFSRICSSFFLTVRHSAPYRSTGLMTVM